MNMKSISIVKDLYHRSASFLDDACKTHLQLLQYLQVCQGVFVEEISQVNSSVVIDNRIAVLIRFSTVRAL